MLNGQKIVKDKGISKREGLVKPQWPVLNNEHPNYGFSKR